MIKNVMNRESIVNVKNGLVAIAVAIFDNIVAAVFVKKLTNKQKLVVDLSFLSVFMIVFAIFFANTVELDQLDLFMSAMTALIDILTTIATVVFVAFAILSVIYLADYFGSNKV